VFKYIFIGFGAG